MQLRPLRRFHLLRRVGQLLSLITVLYGLFRWLKWRQARRAIADRAPGPAASVTPPSAPSGAVNYRRIVIATRNLLCTEGEGAQVQLVPAGLDFVRAALSSSPMAPSVLLITQCERDETEAAVLQHLEAAGVSDNVQALFCSTPDGILHIARSLEPDLYIDVSPSRVFHIRPFMRDAAAAVCISDPDDVRSCHSAPLPPDQLQTITILPTLRDVFAWR